MGKRSTSIYPKNKNNMTVIQKRNPAMYSIFEIPKFTIFSFKYSLIPTFISEPISIFNEHYFLNGTLMIMLFLLCKCSALLNPLVFHFREDLILIFMNPQ